MSDYEEGIATPIISSLFFKTDASASFVFFNFQAAQGKEKSKTAEAVPVGEDGEAEAVATGGTSLLRRFVVVHSHLTRLRDVLSPYTLRFVLSVLSVQLLRLEAEGSDLTLGSIESTFPRVESLQHFPSHSTTAQHCHKSASSMFLCLHGRHNFVSLLLA